MTIFETHVCHSLAEFRTSSLHVESKREQEDHWHETPIAPFFSYLSSTDGTQHSSIAAADSDSFTNRRERQLHKHKRRNDCSANTNHRTNQHLQNKRNIFNLTSSICSSLRRFSLLQPNKPNRTNAPRTERTHLQLCSPHKLILPLPP